LLIRGVRQLNGRHSGVIAFVSRLVKVPRRLPRRDARALERVTDAELTPEQTRQVAKFAGDPAVAASSPQWRRARTGAGTIKSSFIRFDLNRIDFAAELAMMRVSGAACRLDIACPAGPRIHAGPAVPRPALSFPSVSRNSFVDIDTIESLQTA
jgi:hypothetical protein